MQRVVVLLWLLVAWTAIVWVGRIRNLIGDDTLVNWDRAWGIVVALLFLVLAAVTATLPLGLWHRRPLGSTRLVAIFCLWTIAFWGIRGVGLLLADHEAGFKVVHTVLAGVSIGLAVLLQRADRAVAAGAVDSGKADPEAY
ncbi:MAG: hypothetical protein P8K65_07115 [Acidimicrobiales bacterium]|nr:hypothetical protein [Acidimicrobiaceae bacterium]MBT5568475.1 hypothetical protein [Acidimicrobiaceae bacterium]MBT6093210.1 hypothetical protein [Acidimicrobiaceae bacterium]MDG2161146.1 hypothetical protein [Acidimicrobiales bacterium]